MTYRERFTLYHTIAIPLAGICLAIALGTLSLTSRIETDELKFRLNTLSIRTESIDASDLVLRLAEEEAANTRTQKRSTIPYEELRLLTAFPEHKTAGPAASEGLIVRIFHALIALMQRAAGIEPAAHVYLESGLDLITLAYNLERRRFFSEALVTFQKALRPGIDPATRDFILLHSGYVFFFLSEYDSARNAWKEVRTSAALEKNREIAEKLSSWLERFLGRRKKAADVRDNRDRAVRFYQIMAYKESLEALTQVAAARRDAEYFYLRGRVHEAPGEYAAAVEDYRRTIRENRGGDLAALANRRLYLMGALYRENPKLAENAAKMGATTHDKEFFAALAPYASARVFSGPKAVQEDYVSEQAYREFVQITEAKLVEKKEPVIRKIQVVRVRTVNGSVITGREVQSSQSLVVIENENGRFKIPTDDIESKEIVSGN